LLQPLYAAKLRERFTGSEEQGPDFWQWKNDPELLSDPEGWRKREVERVLAELRNKST
jgi:hypothetical protein